MTATPLHIEQLAKDCGEILLKKGWKLSAAESCTGGNISRSICSVSGCSEYYLGSVTSYANSVKINVLGVPEAIINQYGAVSRECVEKMAEGVRKLTGSDISVATSGIAGPGGGSKEKPVGLVWIGISSPIGTRSLPFHHNGNREENITAFTAAALQELLQELQSEQLK